MKVCAQPGCPTLSEQTRCELHRKQKRREQDAKRVRPRHHSNPKWRRARAGYLRAHPICEWHEGCIAPATDVHHFDGLGFDGPQGLDWENLQALCHRHHSQITARMQPAGWHRPS